jgi:hypothetical protein
MLKTLNIYKEIYHPQCYSFIAASYSTLMVRRREFYPFLLKEAQEATLLSKILGHFS